MYLDIGNRIFPIHTVHISKWCITWSYDSAKNSVWIETCQTVMIENGKEKGKPEKNKVESSAML